jgi:hypothetical protein
LALSFLLLLPNISKTQPFNQITQIKSLDLEEGNLCCVSGILDVNDTSNISQVGLCYSTDPSPDLSKSLVHFDFSDLRKLNSEEIPTPAFPNSHPKEKMLSIIETGHGTSISKLKLMMDRIILCEVTISIQMVILFILMKNQILFHAGTFIIGLVL